MKKLAHLLVKYRYWFLGIILMLTAVSGYLITKVTINYDLTAYLPSDSDMNIGLTFMEDEFADDEQSTIKVMVTGLEYDQKTEVYDLLNHLDYGTTVTYELDNDAYNSGDNTLYYVTIPADAYSSLAKEVYEHIETILQDYEAYYAGDVVEAQSNYIVLMALIGVIILFIVLLLLSHSWVEPFVFMFTIGLAVVLNMGTNIVFASVSNITFSIAAVLQLVLSMDYFIMLMDRYRQEKANNDSLTAMKLALSKGAQSIFSSSFTTIMSLLCLVFMSFTFGLDIGLVLAKGILFSLITSFTVLPTLILLFEKLIDKFKKKTLTYKMDKVANLGYRTRYVVVGLFIALMVGATYLSYQTPISYVMIPATQDYKLIEAAFPSQSQVVIVYDNDDEEAIASFAEEVLTLEATLSLDTYATSIGNQLDLEALSSLTDMNEMVIKGLLYDYHNGEIYNLTLYQLSDFIVNDMAANPYFAANFTPEILSTLTMIMTYTDTMTISTPYDAPTIATFTGMDATTVSNIMAMANLEHGLPIDSSMSLYDFVAYTLVMSQDPMYASMFDEASIYQLQLLDGLMNSALYEISYSSEEMALFLSSMTTDLPANYLDMVYLLCSGEAGYQDNWTLSIDQFLTYLVTDFVENEAYASLLDSGSLVALQENYHLVQSAKSSLIGTDHSRMILTTSFAHADEDSLAYLNEVASLLELYDIDYYLVGTLAMAREMNTTFRADLNKITILTALVIFIVVALAFRSWFIPLLLVLFIQTSIYLTMSISLITGSGLYFLAIIIVQAILMGAAIDYAILFTSYYRNARQTDNIRQSLSKAYQGSMSTIMTSSLVLITVTLAVSFISTDPVISSVLLTLTEGMAIAIVLTIFLLPPLIALFDKAVLTRFRQHRHSKSNYEASQK
ncbi:MAG TPA: MMPL family transporter [Bacilli bacterium]|nr:MMPL family transporter [Bacilli bacterium]